MEHTKIQLAKHFSLSDWDILRMRDWTPYIDFDLFPTIYVSPPTCLRFNPWIPSGEGYAICKLPQTLDLKAGRLITYSRTQSAGVGESFAYIGVTAPGENCIRLHIQKMWGAWWLARFDWWQGLDLSLHPCTIVEEYRIIDGEWSLWHTFYHPPMTGNLNRCGVGLTIQSLSADKYFDDTEIWRPM